MVKAAKEKDRLENKQRAVRKWRETNGIEHKPAYFKEWMNPEDGQKYFIYNYEYWEKDKKERKWDRLPDLFSEKLPREMTGGK